jgi:subtilisin family serine protease
MTTVRLDSFDFDLPREDDCWHLDPPHRVVVRRPAPAAPTEPSVSVQAAQPGLSESVRVEEWAGAKDRDRPELARDGAPAGEPVDEYIRVGINARAAWKEGMGEGVRVVILDNGVDFGHPSLSSRINLAAARDFDHGRNGQGGLHVQGGRIDNRFNAHGTACAGIVAAALKPGVRVVGVAPEATLVPIRISTNFEFKSLIAALAYADDAGDVILLPRHLPWADPDPGTAPAAVAQKAQFSPPASGIAKEEFRKFRAEVRSNSTPASAEEAADYDRKATSSEHKEWQSFKAMSSEELSDALADKDDAELSAILQMAIRDVAKRVPIICASGNDGMRSLIYPACLPETVAVGACNEKGYRSTYSQFGKGLDLVAPSNDLAVEDADVIRLDLDEANFRVRAEEERSARLNNHPIPPNRPRDLRELMALPQTYGWNLERFGELSIATTDHTGDFGYNDEPAGDFCLATGDVGFGGTSAAAAQVAGVVALMIGACLKKHGSNRAVVRANLTPEKIGQILRETANKTCLHPEDRLFEVEFGAGLVDAAAAVEAALARV